ncbi:MAG TPA: oligosaccharide flippase family protein [Terriglobales bacterium]
MKSIFRATAVLSGSSMVTILLGLVSAKVMATVLQPAGYGYYGLLQSFVTLAAMVTGVGMASGLVRMGAGAVARGDNMTIAGLRRGAWLLFGGLGAVALALLAAFRVTVSRWTLGSGDHSKTILLMGIALLFTVALNVQTGTLNAYHRVPALAKYAVANAVLGAAVSITCVLTWSVRGIVPAVIGGAIASWAASGYFLHREVGRVQVRPPWSDILKAAWSLLRFGGPFTASMVIGTGVQLILPMVVLHLLSPESVGYYKAAAAISVGYLGFLVTAMSQDYYPRVSAVKDQPQALIGLINEQHRLIMLLAAPVILGTLALVPYLVPLVFSHRFTPTVEILEWQLIGDLFKFSSWTMAYAILARCGSSVYFLTESIGGFATIVTTWLAVHWFGLPGLGISFLLTYIIYYLAVWVIIRRELPLKWTAANKKMLSAAVAAALAIRVVSYTPLAHFRTPLALGLAAIFGGWSLTVLWGEYINRSGTRRSKGFFVKGESTPVTP